MTVATYTGISNVNPAMTINRYGMELTVILKEGNITVQSDLHNYNGSVVSNDFVSFASPLVKGDLIELSADTANTMDATGGLPVVCPAGTSSNLAIGFIAEHPEHIVKMPSENQSTWADMLSNGYYRIAKAYIWCSNIYDGLTPDAESNAITPGNSLIWDISSAGFVYGRAGLSLADSGVYDASGADTGANGFLTEPIAMHYSASNTAYVGVFEGLRPMRTQT